MAAAQARRSLCSKIRRRLPQWTATDAEFDTLTYSISGGVDAAAFSIAPSSGVLTFVSAPNFDVPTDDGADNVYNVQVQVEDGNGGVDAQNIAVTVADDAGVNPPVITSDGGGASASVVVDENQTAVTTVTATDPEGDTLTYSISGGIDAAAFSIEQSSGVLTFVAPPDFEAPTDDGANNVYDVQVQVEDGNVGVDVQDIAVTVADVNEAPTGPIVSAVLPASRSVQVGNVASAFATIINTGATAATNCSIVPLTSVPANFTYQTTDASNLPIGTPNTPATIAAGGSQSYVFAYTPTAPISEVDAELTFDCANTDAAANTVGLNTLLLVADSNPVPDIVALAATPSGDGIVTVSGTGVFATATVNVGVTGTITASADTGSVNLPQLSIALCETDPATGVCINPTVPTTGTVTTTIDANETPTFAFFVTGSGPVPFDPAVNRIFVRFKDGGGITRGSTSVAVRTQ